VYIIHEGLVFLSYIDVNGKKIILDILSPGSVFGDLDFTGNAPSKYENLFIEPFKEAGVCEMSRKDFQEILQNNPEFMLSILSGLSKKLIGLENKVGTLFFSDVEARLISQIVNLGQKYGVEDDRKVTLKMKITHEKLAQMIGAARETVTETLSNLKKRGIIKTNSKNHLTLYKNRLSRLYT
jgi:CRP/FNR family transcriptional regulator